MSEEPILTEQRGDVLEIRLNRPERLNALDLPSFRALSAALERAGLDARVRAVLLTGTGRSFCAGGDVRAMAESRSAGTLPRFFHDLTGEQERSVREILRMPKPVVAALPGVAAGGGLSLALAADWRIAVPDARLVPAFPQLGAVPDGGLTYLLPHFLGIGLTQELLFTASQIPAERARELGLVHEVVPAASLVQRAWERAEELARGPTRTYGWMKRLMLSAFAGGLETQLALERQGAVEVARHGELPEGILAFTERRPARFPPPSADSATNDRSTSDR
jgi:2-(1,2-epoxy-1,2-dihydrophenyl)acetyl-CoA isomerase